MEASGYAGKVLRVDLEEEKISVERPEESYYKKYLGGRGIIMHTLLSEVPPHADPFSRENKLVFAAGLLTGHKLIGTSRASVGAKSPLTDACGESEAGGYWGAELRRAGYDAIIIEGNAGRPLYLWVHDERAELRDAQEIWGLDMRQAMEWFQKDIGEKKYRTALIGPAGENRVRFANIIVDCNHAFGRAGLGAVMGAKNLKGVIVKGSKIPEAAEKERVLQLNRIMKERYKRSVFVKYGTGGAMKTFEELGNLPVRNWSGGSFPQVEKIDAVTLKHKYGAGMESCFNCPISCKKKIQDLEEPWSIDSVYGGPEYETLASFGSNLLIDDLSAICKANELCNRYGLDTISTGATIAFAMECFENGLLKKQDTDGVELKFGYAPAMLDVLEKIALRKGIGDLLAEGSKRAAQQIGKGALDFSMQVKGQEIPFHNPRLNQGLAIHYSVHAVGADHVSGTIDHLLPGLMADWDTLDQAETMDPTELSTRKARMTYLLGLWRAMPNYLGLCNFVPWRYKEVCEGVEAITGWKITAWKLMKAVERGITMMRVFNLREGFTHEHDFLPERFHEPAVEGPLKGVKIDREKFEEIKKIYYQMLGWDTNGVPRKSCLAALDLEWLSSYIDVAED